jgi:hypothetical protein
MMRSNVFACNRKNDCNDIIWINYRGRFILRKQVSDFFVIQKIIQCFCRSFQCINDWDWDHHHMCRWSVIVNSDDIYMSFRLNHNRGNVGICIRSSLLLSFVIYSQCEVLKKTSDNSMKIKSDNQHQHAKIQQKVYFMKHELKRVLKCIRVGIWTCSSRPYQTYRPNQILLQN